MICERCVRYTKLGEEVNGHVLCPGCAERYRQTSRKASAKKDSFDDGYAQAEQDIIDWLKGIYQAKSSREFAVNIEQGAHKQTSED